MHNFTWNRFPVKNLLIGSLLETPIVESTYLESIVESMYLNIDMQMRIITKIWKQNTVSWFLKSLYRKPWALVVLKWMRVGSLSFHSWMEICSREESGRWRCGWKNVNFLLFVYSTNKKLQNDFGLDGNVYSTQGQAALTAVTDVIRVCLVHRCLFLLSRWCEIFAIIFFVIFVGEEFTVFGFVKEEYKKNFENHWPRVESCANISARDSCLVGYELLVRQDLLRTFKHWQLLTKAKICGSWELTCSRHFFVGIHHISFLLLCSLSLLMRLHWVWPIWKHVMPDVTSSACIVLHPWEFLVRWCSSRKLALSFNV